MFNFSYGLDEDPTALQLRLMREMNPNIPREGQPIRPIDEYEWGVAQSQLGTPQPGFDFSRMDTSKAYDRDIGDPERFSPITNTTAGGGDRGVATEMAPNAPQTLQPTFGRVGQAFLQDEGGILEQVRRMRPDAYQGLLQQGPKSPLGNQIAGRAASGSPTGEIPGAQAPAAGVAVSGANGADRSNVPQPPEARDQTQANGPGSRPFSSTGTPLERPGSGFMDRLAENSDLLMGLGAGLMKGKNWSEGMAMGLEGAQKGAALGATTKAQQAKAQRELLSLQGNAQFLMKAYPGLSLPQAIGLAANPATVTEAVKRQFPSEQWVEETDEHGRKFLRNTQNNDKKMVAGEPRADETTWREMTPEEIAARPKLDQDKSWKINSKGDIQPIGGQGQTINVGGAAHPIVGQLAEQFATSRKEAAAAADQVRSLNEANKVLDSNGQLIAGAKAGDRLSLQKLGRLIGVDDAGSIEKTESLRSSLKTVVKSALQGLGTQATDNDLRFAQDASGGNLELDERSIRTILDMNRRAAMSKIQRHNELADQMDKATTDPQQRKALGTIQPMMRVQPPEPYQPPEKPAAAPAPGALPRITSPADAMRLKPGTHFLDANGVERVRP